MKFSFFCICLFVFWISCSTNSGTSGVLRNDSLYVVDVDRAEREKVLFMSSLFQKANAIVLDTSVWIGSLDKIQGLNNRIFILDRHQAKGVFEFTRDGVFVRQIGSRGNGPGEYIVPGDFSLDGERSDLYTRRSKTNDQSIQYLRWEIPENNCIGQRVRDSEPSDTVGRRIIVCRSVLF